MLCGTDYALCDSSTSPSLNKNNTKESEIRKLMLCRSSLQKNLIETRGFDQTLDSAVAENAVIS